MRMDWPEGGAPYTEEIRRLDEEICRLVAERDRRTGESRVVPGEGHLGDWAERHGIGELRLRGLVANLSAVGVLRRMPPSPQGLRRVVPLMRRQMVQGMHFTLTHCMQHRTPGGQPPHG